MFLWANKRLVVKRNAPSSVDSLHIGGISLSASNEEALKDSTEQETDEITLLERRLERLQEPKQSRLHSIGEINFSLNIDSAEFYSKVFNLLSSKNDRLQAEYENYECKLSPACS